MTAALSTSAPESEGPPGAATRPKVNRAVFAGSGVSIVLFSLWAILAPEQAATVIGAVVGWIATNMGWFYVLTAAVVTAFVVIVAVSREGTIKMGPDHSKPQYNLFTWTAMLFAAGIGIDLLFFSVAEPVTQYYGPPTGEGGSLEATRMAVVWTLFHYGVIGWAMYALMGMAFGYFAYRWNMPLSIRSALYPLIGKRVHGRAGDAVDIAALLGTIFGVATSLGIGVVQLNYGLFLLFGIEEGVAAQTALIAVAVVMATASCVSGVDKGIRRLSELNVLMAVALVAWVLIAGRTSFLLDATVQNLGDYVAELPGMALDTFAYTGAAEWMAGWTLFFWAWWIAWAPFVGLFLARISRGRTLREFVVATLTVPFVFILILVSVFGNSALEIVTGGDDAFGQAAMNTPERAFYSLLEQYPGAPLLIGLATLSGLLFYVTSADSGALVMSTFTSTIQDPTQDGPKWLRVFWAAATGLLTLAMLLVGGVATLQAATLIIGLPFSVVMYLVMIGFWKALRAERSQREGRSATRRSVTASRTPGPDSQWRRRLTRIGSFPGPRAVRRYEEHVLAPALAEVVEEFCAQGHAAELSSSEVGYQGLSEYTLTVPMGDDRSFCYQIYPVATPVPAFGGFRTNPDSDLYYRLEVFNETGSQGTDVMDWNREQLINDVLDNWEAHLAFLSIHDGPSMIQDGAEGHPDWSTDIHDVPTGQTPAVTKEAHP
ncbi:choline BCCT transporter BetT [Kocuria sp. CPCC 205292]|uniref:choline BCCT transporter BetT n=1 Tax=Kocuria cellulosilytica TaxID=3071451 RepID=UPI0034D5C32A